MFHFKHFFIHQEHAAQKVGTDAMLLGSLCQFQNESTVLDIGTGTGVLSLMVAQRFQPKKVVAIDVDENSIVDATTNLKNAPFLTDLQLIHTSLQDFESAELFDGILSNPPFFNHSTKSVEQSKNLARHTDSLSYLELVNGIDRLLMPNGIAWIILPTEAEHKWLDALHSNQHLFINDWIVIFGKPDKPKRFICSLSRTKCEMRLNSLTVRNENETYSEEYISLTSEFHNRKI